MTAGKTKYQISFSGGLASGVTALIAHENGLDFNLLFADTLIEDEDLYRFNDDIARAVGKKIVHIKTGKTPWDVFVDHKFIGNSRLAHCSTYLKTLPVRDWLREHGDKGAVVDPLVLGMDYSEQDRLERAQKRWDRPVISLLNQFKVWRPAYEGYLQKYGIEKPRLYKYGFEHNNCGGFCVKAGQVQFERLYRMMPERYAWHEKQMIIASDKIGETAKPFLRMTVGGELKYLTLTQFREHLESGTGELDMFSESGCGCFSED